MLSRRERIWMPEESSIYELDSNLKNAKNKVIHEQISYESKLINYIISNKIIWEKRLKYLQYSGKNDNEILSIFEYEIKRYLWQNNEQKKFNEFKKNLKK